MRFFCFLSISLAFVSYTDHVCFQESIRLAPKDFHARVVKEMKRNVYGSFGLKLHYDEKNAQTEICAYFDPHLSYCALDYKESELLHENYRWKIFELAALEMVKKERNRRSYDCSGFDFRLDKQLLDKYSEMDRKYNVECKYGLVLTKEMEWQPRIDSLYWLLRPYKDSSLYRYQ